ncbi:MAG: RiPP maturation radical SAM C-methyltransferase [Myxococcaceae bacterium]|nr:RiPP maturation radical SAM C-methyltransferase [Myxococcaceae bacterium]
MKCVLLALPWSVYERPSAALGSLSAYLQQHAPDFQTECRYDYVDVALQLGFPLYDGISLEAYDIGELLYTPFLYPERRAAVRDYFVSSVTKRGGAWRLDNAERFPEDTFGEAPTHEGIFERIQSILGAHLDKVVAEVAAAAPDVVGLTTCFGQLFANLSLARRLKEASPRTKVVMGGSTVSSKVGPSLLREYPFLDYVIQGEGEQPLLALLRELEAGATDMLNVQGVLSASVAPHMDNGVALWETRGMDELPLPDYDAYAAKAEQHGFLWVLPVEGSRGCWWDRTRRTGNPKQTCHFCNLNVQWNGYREKTTPRLVSEMVALSERYGNSAIFFLDNIIRAKGIEEFARGILDSGKDFALFYEMRAHVSPWEILQLWEAGVRFVQFGIEGLSASFLKRIGKGTSVITNLQAMKTCHELEISNNANLLTRYPGSLPEEVAETVENILTYALQYEPLSANGFWLGRGSTIDVLREQFPVSHLRNADFYKAGLPEEVYQRLALFDLSFDVAGEPADWAPVHEACELWTHVYSQARQGPYKHLMAYLDGGSFIRILDGRSGQARTILLRGRDRDVYVYCMEVRRFEELAAEFPELGEPTLRGLLEDWSGRALMFREGDRYLSLAPAFTPEQAARRIRNLHERELRGRQHAPPAQSRPAR